MGSVIAEPGISCVLLILDICHIVFTYIYVTYNDHGSCLTKLEETSLRSDKLGNGICSTMAY